MLRTYLGNVLSYSAKPVVSYGAFVPFALLEHDSSTIATKLE